MPAVIALLIQLVVRWGFRIDKHPLQSTKFASRQPVPAVELIYAIESYIAVADT